MPAWQGWRANRRHHRTLPELATLPPSLQVKVLHQAPASSSSSGSSSSGSGPRGYQMQVVLEEEVPAGSTVELHW